MSYSLVLAICMFRDMWPLTYKRGTTQDVYE